MKLTTKALLIFSLFTIISKANFSQQISDKVYSDKQLVYQFNSYTVEKDKLLHNEFKNQSQIKIIFSCIPSGIVVIESPNTISEHDIEIINQIVNRIDNNYIKIYHLTQKEAESKCATYRSN